MGNTNDRLVLGRIIVRNRLRQNITNVRVRYGAGNKPQNHSIIGIEYWFNWATIDLERGTNVIFQRELLMGDIESRQESDQPGFDVSTYYRGYWQIYFQINGIQYRINKNNAQVNVHESDNLGDVEITLLHEGERIRANFQLSSGNAYFYVTDEFSQSFGLL